jgi:hypothetical protein
MLMYENKIHYSQEIGRGMKRTSLSLLFGTKYIVVSLLQIGNIVDLWSSTALLHVYISKLANLTGKVSLFSAQVLF